MRWTMTVSQSREEISTPEKNCRGQRKQTTTVAVAQIADEGDRQVLGDLCGDGDRIHLKLAVVETGEEERTVERECSDRSGT